MQDIINIRPDESLTTILTRYKLCMPFNVQKRNIFEDGRRFHVPEFKSLLTEREYLWAHSKRAKKRKHSEEIRCLRKFILEPKILAVSLICAI